MKKFLTILLFVYILWRDDFKKFFRILKCSDDDLINTLVKELTSKSSNELNDDWEDAEDDPDDDDLPSEDKKNVSSDLQTYTREQVMELLHVSKVTLWRYYTKRKLLTARKVGPNHVIFIKDEVQQTAPQYNNTDGEATRDKVERIVQLIEQRGIDITAGYDVWLRIGFAFSSEFGEGGRDFFHRVSRQNSKYDYHEADKQYNNCLSSKGEGITIGTFFQMAKDAGIDISGKSAAH